MRKVFLALTLLSVAASTAALAHGGTDQEEKACMRDVQRFCRTLMDQGDFTILACLKEIAQSSRPPAATCWSATGSSERSMEEARSCLDPDAGFIPAKL